MTAKVEDPLAAKAVETTTLLSTAKLTKVADPLAAKAVETVVVNRVSNPVFSRSPFSR